MSAPIVYRFEDIGAELELVPLAGRRALDRAGVKVGLESWRTLSHEAREAVAALGSAESVDAAAVRRQLVGVAYTPCDGLPEPGAHEAPSEIAPALASAGLDLERWSRLRALDRWALASLAARGRTDGLAKLVAELA